MLSGEPLPGITGGNVGAMPSNACSGALCVSPAFSGDSIGECPVVVLWALSRTVCGDAAGLDGTMGPDWIRPTKTTS